MELQGRILKLKEHFKGVPFPRPRSSSCGPAPEQRPPSPEPSSIQRTKNASKSTSAFPHLVYTAGSPVELDVNANDAPNSVDIFKFQQPDRRRWKTIEHQLNLLKFKAMQSTVPPGKGFGNLVRSTVISYRTDYNDTDFKMLDDPEIIPKMRVVLPIIVDLALNLPNLFENTIPLLESGVTATISVSRKLCASLLANAFLCTICEDNRIRQDGEKLPNINFFGLFNAPSTLDPGRYSMKREKLKCLLNYFARRWGNLNDDLEKISFHRRFRNERVQWKDSNRSLCKVNLLTTEMIEDAEGKLQVDFANRVIGGGVLNNGCVQEEIRFATWPELILGRLFVEPLTDNEVLVMTGAKKYSEYSGYSKTFKYLGPTRDSKRRSESQVVAMDATYFKNEDPERQYEKDAIDRELHKAFVGFLPNKFGDNVAVATGNWGCGAFNGDPQLKFLLQWMAASENERECILYHTFGNENQTDEIKRITRLLGSRAITVGQLYETLLEYATCIGRYKSVFRFLVKTSSQKKNPGLCTCL